MFNRINVLSRPIGIEWAGWHSDTYRLQQSGWEIAVEQDLYRCEYRLILKHSQANLYAVTHKEIFENPFEVVGLSYDLSRVPIFNVISVSSKIENFRCNMDFNNVTRIDAQPTYVSEDVLIENIENFNIFNIPLTKAEEILIDKSDMTVIEHLEAIKMLQNPKQAEIRKQMIDQSHVPDSKLVQEAPVYTTHSNIIEFKMRDNYG